MAKRNDPVALDQHEALLRAIADAGSQGRFAAICGCTTPNIWQIVRRRGALPARYVLAVERELRIPRSDLRPDIYPPSA